MGLKGLIFILLIGLLAYWFYKTRKSSQLSFIENYRFNSVLSRKLKAKYPHLSDDDTQLVLEGLREYFYICSMAKRKMVAMPSQAVDVAWHEFILFTRAYKGFCNKALGRFLHHTPTEAMATRTLAQQGIKRAWRLSCAKGGINPSSPASLPLLFAIDAQLGIDDGFKYSLDCKNKASPMYGDGYCAGHIACASGCAGDSGGQSDGGGFFDFFGDSSGCGGDCGGGCGGD